MLFSRLATHVVDPQAIELLENMRALTLLVVCLLVSACSSAPVAHPEPYAAETADLQAPRPQTQLNDVVIQGLLTASATDFHASRPSDPGRFRSVRIGHLTTDDGNAQYLLCGEFLASRSPNGFEWQPFATNRTSDYEQWLGGQAQSLCQRPSITWDGDADLSLSLQERLDSLR